MDTDAITFEAAARPTAYRQVAERARLVRERAPSGARLTARGRRQLVSLIGTALLALALAVGGGVATSAEAGEVTGGDTTIGFTR